MDQPTSNRTSVVIGAILGTILVGWVLHVGAAILQPLVIALLLASMLQPVVRFLARWKIPPFVTVITLALLLFLGLARLGLLLQSNIASFVAQPVAEAPPEVTAPLGVGGEQESPVETGVDTGVDTGAEPDGPDEETDLTPGEEPGGWERTIEGIRFKLHESELIPRPLAELIVGSLATIDLAGLATDLIGGGFDFAKGLVLVIIYMLFIFAEQAVFRRKILSVAGERRESAELVLDTVGRGIQRYLGVKTVTSMATGLLCYSVLIGLKIPYAPLWGFLTFLLNYIPTFGSIAAAGFPTLVALAVEPSGEKALIVVFTYLAVNLMLGNYIEPKVLGRELNLSPLVIIISVVVWAGLWGVVGTFLAVPLTATLQIIFASHDNTRPLAVLLSSGPPKEERKRRSSKLDAKRAASDTDAAA